MLPSEMSQLRRSALLRAASLQKKYFSGSRESDSIKARSRIVADGGGDATGTAHSPKNLSDPLSRCAAPVWPRPGARRCLIATLTHSDRRGRGGGTGWGCSATGANERTRADLSAA